MQFFNAVLRTSWIAWSRQHKSVRVGPVSHRIYLCIGIVSLYCVASYQETSRYLYLHQLKIECTWWWLALLVGVSVSLWGFFVASYLDFWILEERAGRRYDSVGLAFCIRIHQLLLSRSGGTTQHQVRSMRSASTQDIDRSIHKTYESLWYFCTTLHAAFT